MQKINFPRWSCVSEWARHTGSSDSWQMQARNYIRGIAMRDSIWNNENRSRIAELKIIHDIEQKEMTIAKLEQKNRMSNFRQRTIIAVGLLVISLLVTALLYIQKRRMVGHQNFIIKEQE